MPMVFFLFPSYMEKNTVLDQLRRRQLRYEDTGGPDTTREQFFSAGLRDTSALLLGSAASVGHISLALGTPPAAVRLRLLDSIIDPLDHCK